MPAITPLNQPNRTRNFYPVDNLWESQQLPIKESIAFEQGTALAWEVVGSTSTGKLIKMPTTNATGQNFAGVIMEEIRSTDGDYATAFKTKLVSVPKSPDALCRFRVGAGTFTNIDIGKVVQFHTDSSSLAVDTLGNGAEMVGLVSSTIGLCKFNTPRVVTA
jgi:hypothetical protein